jgi:pyruvate formate lyase activating enzyme
MRTAVKTQKCIQCGEESPLIASALQVCKRCIIEGSNQVLERIARRHALCRTQFGLPPSAPRASEGTQCLHCVNECSIAPGDYGLCGVKTNHEGRLRHLAGLPRSGNVEFYYDPLPTNCVASWVCPEGENAGAVSRDRARSFARAHKKNLAVFYNSCTFDCLFCQNWHFRERTRAGTSMTATELAAQVDEHTACICYFGGDPTSQILHAINASRIARRASRNPAVRICWETNGSMDKRFCRTIAEISFESGGCIKFDLKALNANLHFALTGASNRNTLENFRWLAEFQRERRVPSFLIASTLLVPGYIDENEVHDIARFIASLGPEIPYSLLGFYPQFFMYDLPITSQRHAERCYDAAKDAGLTRVNLGNKHLLSSRDY